MLNNAVVEYFLESDVFGSWRCSRACRALRPARRDGIDFRKGKLELPARQSQVAGGSVEGLFLKAFDPVFQRSPARESCCRMEKSRGHRRPEVRAGYLLVCHRAPVHVQSQPRSLAVKSDRRCSVPSPSRSHVSAMSVLCIASAISRPFSSRMPRYAPPRCAVPVPTSRRGASTNRQIPGTCRIRLTL